MWYYWPPVIPQDSALPNDSWSSLSFDTDAWDTDAWSGLDAEEPTLRLVIAGDSITADPSLSGTVVFNDMALAAAFMPYEVQNLSIGGAQLLRYVDTRNAELLAAYTTVYGSSGCWLIIAAGINDLSAYSATGRALYAAVITLTVQAHALGVRVCVGTILPSLDLEPFPVKEAERVAFNAFVRANAAAADAIADTASEPIMGLQSTTHDVAYYLEGTHPSSAGVLLIRAVYETALNYYFAQMLKVTRLRAVRWLDTTPLIRVLS